MNENERILIEMFEEIKSRGWIRTDRHSDQMLGNTFEDLLSIVENNSRDADWRGIELKTHRNLTQSPVSLFTKAPTHPKRANTYLRNTYGVDDNCHGMPMLNTRIKGDSYNTHRGGYAFKLDVNRLERRIYLHVKNMSTGEIVDESIYWEFSVLERALTTKIKKIAVIYGDDKNENGSNFVKFDKMVIVSGLNIENMINALENGDLYLEFRLGVYASGPKLGRNHDHGSGFRMNIQKLLEYGVVIE